MPVFSEKREVNLNPLRHESYWGAKVLVCILALSACYLYFDATAQSHSIPGRPFGHALQTFTTILYISTGRAIAPSGRFRLGTTTLEYLGSSFSLIDRYDEFQIFLLNSLFLMLGLYFYFLISDYFRLGRTAYFLFLINAFLLYFALLINKDMATFAIVMISAWLALRRKYWVLIALIPIAFIVRQQLAMFLALIVFLEVRVLSYRLKVIVAFVVGSIVGIVLFQIFRYMSVTTLGEGLTGQMSQFFLEREWLAPIGVPLRLLLYVFDYFSAIFPVRFGAIDALRALRIPSIVFFLVMIPRLINVRMDRARYIAFAHYRPVVSVVVALLATLLVNPQINAPTLPASSLC